MKLSENLNLSEVTRSESAKRNGIDNTPTDAHIENLKKLATNIFQPIRDHFKKPILISSGYRSEKLNRLVPGTSLTSDHCFGRAIDIDMDGTKISNNDVFHYIKNNLKFKQLIAEFPINGNLSWVHVSYDENNLKNQILIATKKNGETVYLPYKGNEKIVK
jgi:uncharacterized protein (DUF433 family)